MNIFNSQDPAGPNNKHAGQIDWHIGRGAVDFTTPAFWINISNTARSVTFKTVHFEKMRH